jgi:hypothetical protein
MTDLEILLAIAGFAVTALVVAGMILLTPRGQIELDESASDGQGSDLSRADVPDARPALARSGAVPGGQ